MVRPSSRAGAAGSALQERDTGTLPLDDVFGLLCDPVRRHALYELHFSVDGVVSVERVATATGRTMPGAPDPEQVAEELDDEHLPALAEAGIVEYDRPSSKLWYRPRPALTEWLEHAAYTELPRSDPLLTEHESRF